jgi:transposase InsO family protein
MMIDEDIVSVSPSTTYRVLKQAGLLSRWNTDDLKSTKRPFVQPTAPHEQWHIDIKYVNVMGTFLFFIGIIDGYSRYIVNHELRSNMTEYDVELTLLRAKEKYPRGESTGNHRQWSPIHLEGLCRVHSRFRPEADTDLDSESTGEREDRGILQDAQSGVSPQAKLHRH